MGCIAITDLDAELDVYDFEHLTTLGLTAEQALVRMRLSAKTIERRYKQLHRTVPASIYILGSTKKADLCKAAA